MATLTAATANDKWKIDQLLEYVKAELESRESCTFAANPNEEPKSRRGLQNGDYSASSLLTGASDNFTLVCTYCGKDHATSKCDIVTEISARKSLLRKNRRCFLCLKPNHIKFCRTNYKFVKCNGRHHVSICEPYPLSPDKSTEPGVETNRVNKNIISNTKSSTFLQIARAVATDCENQNSKELRVLFDGCSRMSFITTTVSGILKLQSIRKERIIIKALGNKEEAMRLLDVVNTRIYGTFRRKRIVRSRRMLFHLFVILFLDKTFS